MHLPVIFTRLTAKSVVEIADFPVYAIGGITAARMPEILQAGAAGGCMMSGFMKMTP